MKSVCWRVLLLVLVVAGAACSNKDRVESAKGAQPAAASVPVPEMPGTLTDVNVAAADMGGAVEELHENYGPGLTGRRLIDGLLDQTWLTPAGWYGYWMYNKTGWAKHPVDAVLSFYERQPALVAAVVIVVPDAMSVKLEGDVSTAPKDV